MTEYVFRPFRHGVRARLFSGRFTLNRGDKVRTVALGTPDKLVARHKLRELIVSLQREEAGLIAPASEREAAATPLVDLLAQFEADLKALERDATHVHDTCARIRRILKETGWKRLRDIRADEFTTWRTTLTVSAKTKKEYHASIRSFLNWLVRLDRIAANPLAKVSRIPTRGKQVRLARSFTAGELAAIYRAAPTRRLAYQMLAYTGQRSAEVKALVWGDLHISTPKAYALFRVETMKDAAKRAVPLHSNLAQALRDARPEGVRPDVKVFRRFPRWKVLMTDLKRAGIARKDATGRVVHLHSFRKTFQTFGANAGVNQRAAQEILGHSDPRLTAEVYTDIAALELHREIAKLPWVTESLGEATAIRSLSIDFPSVETRLHRFCGELLALAEIVKKEDLTKLSASENWWTQLDSNQ